MFLHGKLDSSEVNGPGTRAVIWFQGCTLNCVGCWNQDTHKFDPDTYVSNQEMHSWLLGLEGVEGVTFSGGEPMQHVIDLLDLTQYIKDVRPDLSIGIFSGYTQRELETGNWRTMHPMGMLGTGAAEIWTKVADHLDFAVMGRFNAAKLTTSKPLCGSSNQDVVLFSDRYTAKDFKPQATQVTISADGLVQITGYPGTEFLDAVKKQNSAWAERLS